MLPLFKMVNFVAPDLDAVKMSPRPDWSMTSVANEVFPEIDDTLVVAELPRTSRVANGLFVPIPILPLVKAVSAVVPPGIRATLPVLAEPSCNVWALVVAKIPVPVKDAALLPLAERDAVG